MKTIFYLCCCMLCFLVAAGCAHDNATSPTKNLKLQSSLDSELTRALVEAYNLKAKNKITLIEKQEKGNQVDLYLDTSFNLNRLAVRGVLVPATADEMELVPSTLRNQDGLWCGVFFDPIVLLVNQSYSRRIGQEKLRSWYDLPDLPGVRLVVENLSDNYSTKDFMASMASNMGQQQFIAYFKRLKPHIVQYGKFPITSVRMATTGDADIAITRRSSVFKYLQSDFPAYVQLPLNGVPINLYGVALAKESQKQEAAAEFVEWLLTSEAAKGVVLQQRAGYLFVLPEGSKGKAVRSDNLWLNTFYTDEKSLEALSNVWLKEIRLESLPTDKALNKETNKTSNVDPGKADMQ